MLKSLDVLKLVLFEIRSRQKTKVKKKEEKRGRKKKKKNKKKTLYGPAIPKGDHQKLNISSEKISPHKLLSIQSRIPVKWTEI